jgi:hypothetical protein
LFRFVVKDNNRIYKRENENQSKHENIHYRQNEVEFTMRNPTRNLPEAISSPATEV